MNGPKTGNPNPVLSAPTVSADVIAVGDLLWQDTSNANAPRPASAFTWNTDLATTQAGMKAVFLGVSLSAKPAGKTDPVRIGTAGEYEFTCAAATFKLGDPVGPAKQTGNALESQKVVAAVASSSVLRVSANYASNTTRVRARLSNVGMDGPYT